MSTSNPNFALVTGASSGIGAIYAERLARRGYGLVLVARNEERLRAVAQRIAKVASVPVELLPADLGRAEGLRAVEKVLREDARISLLVNNAGVGAASKLVDSEVDKMEAMIDLNVKALTRLSYAVVPRFVERGAGTIVNISSIVAISPETLNGVYGGTKAFVLAFTQSLQHEVGAKGVRVQAVLPGATATEFWDIAGLPVKHLPKEIVMTAEDMVDAALAGLDRGEVVTIPSLPDEREWTSYEAARLEMSKHLSSTKPAARYQVG
ncbi:Short-chain dehydrogenase [Labilithrix luteola]|uniref:Short-chain dehydrogenase n=1 Tax=Labilithrix luteola TaxID=1391654 RepID=A0A0K1PPN4_9BACT|nr:SDR family oxidoreductase [Labilithrix luteola]AKU95483.1 Short-chain dehydrogenase [Labilithrix luteola]